MVMESIKGMVNAQVQQVQQAPRAAAVPKADSENTEGNTVSGAVAAMAENGQGVATAAKKEGGARSDSGEREKDQESPTSIDALRRAVENINKNLENSSAIFGIHDNTNRVTIKIVDKDTKEVLKELPPEKTLDMIAKVWELAGLMVDEKR